MIRPMFFLIENMGNLLDIRKTNSRHIVRHFDLSSKDSSYFLRLICSRIMNILVPLPPTIEKDKYFYS